VAHPVFDASKYPLDRAEARGLFDALRVTVTDPARIELLYRFCGPDLQPLPPKAPADLMWNAALDGLAAGRKLRIFCGLVREDKSLAALRGAIDAVVNASEAPVNHLPLRPAVFIGRDEELAELRTRVGQPGAVVHIAEMAGRGKTALALEFAHRCQSEFERVYWLSCQSGSLAVITAELARLLGLPLEGDTAEITRRLRELLAAKRCLLVLDNVEVEAPGELIPGGAASVIITTRQRNLKFLRLRRPLELPVFTEAQCFTFFLDQLGKAHVSRHEEECSQLFARLGYLPLAVGLAASLIREDPRYTISSLVKKDLPDDVIALIREAIGALDENPQKLLAAMAACAREGFGLDLAAEIAQLDEEAAMGALAAAMGRSLVEELDRDERRYQLHALVRRTAGGEALGRRHADAMLRRFEQWEANWKSCEQNLADFRVAFDWGIDNLGSGFNLGSLAYHGARLTDRIGRNGEAFDICQRMTGLAERTRDQWLLQVWAGNQAVILKAWGRLDEAMTLLKRQEEICVHIGDQEGLLRCYGHQGEILRAWGQLEDAMVLLQKQEAICLEVGNQDGLVRSYGYQAEILKAWERLDEAMVLLKKQEAIALQPGKRGYLSTCYGNQAVILKAWGRPDEAMELHKKEEAICVELGNRDGLQLSYGTQALILRDWGRLEEALELFRKKEVICLELGKRPSLGYCHWFGGLIEGALGNAEVGRKRLETALALFRELGMQWEIGKVEADLAEARGGLGMADAHGSGI
jgi:tetratricopeptide (TPR) repeat protein